MEREIYETYAINTLKAKYNLERILEKQKEKQKELEAINNAKLLFEYEPTENKEIIVELYNEKNENDVIYCNVESIAKQFNYPPSKIERIIEAFISKKYFTEIKDHAFDSLGYVVRINPNLISVLEITLNQFHEQKRLLELSKSLSSQSLANILGYDNNLKAKLIKIVSIDLQDILIRDMEEAAIDLAIGSYKSSMILCGSTIEALLLDILLQNKESAVQTANRYFNDEQNKRFPRNLKNLENWSLGLLLEVAYKLGIMSNTTYHLGNGIKDFRNLVHPGKEKRNILKVNKENAEIVWGILKSIINELSAGNA